MTKTKTEAPHLDTRAKILELLRAADGEPITSRMLAVKIKTGEAAVKHVAEHLIDSGAIRGMKISKSSTAYYMPNERQLVAEEKSRQVNKPKELALRKAHLEAVMKARAVREQINSIG